MSDTPRTDEATYPAWCMDREKPVVDAAVAYGLERELAAARAELATIRRIARYMTNYGGELEAERSRLTAKLDLLLTPMPLEKWHEDDGFALWWKFPIEEPPYCGDPRSSDWPGYHTHWTPLIVPKEAGR